VLDPEGLTPPPVIPDRAREPQASRALIRDLVRRDADSLHEVPDSLDYVSASGMTG